MEESKAKFETLCKLMMEILDKKVRWCRQGPQLNVCLSSPAE